MRANDIVQPVAGRQTSAGVKLAGLRKCKVLRYISPKGGESHAVLQLEVLEGRASAQARWSSTSRCGYTRHNRTLDFHGNFKQPTTLKPGTIFRCFASAFELVSGQDNSSSQDYNSISTGYCPPADDDLLTIMALQ